MIECKNCGKEVAKYKTVEVEPDLFSELSNKIKDENLQKVRICESCYDDLSEKMDSSEDAHLHPNLREYDDSD